MRLDILKFFHSSKPSLPEKVDPQVSTSQLQKRIGNRWEASPSLPHGRIKKRTTGEDNFIEFNLIPHGRNVLSHLINPCGEKMRFPRETLTVEQEREFFRGDMESRALRDIIFSQNKSTELLPLNIDTNVSAAHSTHEIDIAEKTKGKTLEEVYETGKLKVEIKCDDIDNIFSNGEGSGSQDRIAKLLRDLHAKNGQIGDVIGGSPFGTSLVLEDPGSKRN